jgi:hypothetical protein
MSKSIFHISQEYAHLEILLLESGGDLSPEIEQALAINREEFEHKATAYHHIILKAEAEELIIDGEIKRLQALSKANPQS